MKHTLIAMAFIAALTAGCNQQAPADGTPAVTTTPSEAAKPIHFEVAPLQVGAKSINEQDRSVLAGAAWTAKQCSLTLKGIPESQMDIEAAKIGSTHFSGFFIDPRDQPAGEFEIVLKGEQKNFSIPAKTGWDRTDVADFFKLPQLANSGFDVMADLSTVPSGKYKIDYMVERDGAKFFCESGKTVVIQNNGSHAAS